MMVTNDREQLERYIDTSKMTDEEIQRFIEYLGTNWHGGEF